MYASSLTALRLFIGKEVDESGEWGQRRLEGRGQDRVQNWPGLPLSFALRCPFKGYGYSVRVRVRVI